MQAVGIRFSFAEYGLPRRRKRRLAMTVLYEEHL